MTLRVKLLLVVAPTVALMLAACAYIYASGAGAVEGLLRGEEEARAAHVAGRVEESMRVYESHLARLAASSSLREYVAGAGVGGDRAPTDTVRAAVAALLGDGERLAAVTCLDGQRRPLFRARVVAQRDGGALTEFQTEDFISTLIRYDERVWSLDAPAVLRSAVSQESFGSGVRATAPVFSSPGGGVLAGALVMELNLTAIFEEADGATRAEGERAVIALDNESGRAVYHTNEGLRNQDAVAAMPYFEGVRGRMSKDEAGFDSYEAPGGDRWVAAFRRVGGTSVSVAAAADYTRASAPVRRAGVFGLALSLLAGVVATALVFIATTRAARRIERVAEGAAAIARGDLDQHVDVESTGATRALAVSFNLMSERLREHIAREAETRQFESFMRLSAMLTHDLKNAITGLSMLVSNMERLYDREEFRADAIASLRDATDKLKRIVSRLNEPMKSLSGEYRLAARQTDLVPIINRVLAMNAVPSVPLYEIETRMPESLIATVEPERIENVVENLVINALEAMGVKGGRLTVEAGPAGEETIFFSVADTGPGMSEEFIHERLFRPFATTKSKGIGLGLFTCREVVEAHGGRLEVESRPGAGTRFRVVLPSAPFTSRERERRRQAEKRAATAAAVSGERP